MDKKIEKCEEIENTITKKYRHKIWGKFIAAIKDYELIEPNDKIAVCVSGGKDSFLLAKCMELLHKYSEVPFEYVILTMDPGYNPINRQLIEKNAKILNVNIHFFNSDIFQIVAGIDKSPCYLCARMRRGALYGEAQRLGCNKIALGHHFDDVIETTLMSILYSGKFEGMMPKVKSDNFPNMSLIRPFYYVKESDIKAWANFNELEFIQCACRFTEACTVCDNGGGGSKRQEVKTLISKLRKTNPFIDDNLFNAMKNVNIEKVLGYFNDQGKTTYLDQYKKGK